MSTTTRPLSIRCDLHPPMTASMYCAQCKTFLCRICAEIKPGGRFCATCKRLCVQHSADEMAAFYEQRVKAKQDTVQAKEAAEKLKAERDTKFKAEVAARKIEWAQKQAAAQALSQQMPATILVNVASAHAQPSPGSAANNKDSELRKALKSTDDLSKLGERSYLTVIGRARNYMLLIGVLTLLINGALIWWISDKESQLDNQIESTRHQEIERITAELKTVKSADQRKQLEMERSIAEAGQNFASTVGHGIFFFIKAFLGCYLAVGALLLGLYFVCETYPRGATMTAFIVYLLFNFVDLIFIRSGGIFMLLFRWGALVALYNGMQAGQTLYRMRVDSGEYREAI